MLAMALSQLFTVWAEKVIYRLNSQRQEACCSTSRGMRFSSQIALTIGYRFSILRQGSLQVFGDNPITQQRRSLAASRDVSIRPGLFRAMRTAMFTSLILEIVACKSLTSRGRS